MGLFDKPFGRRANPEAKQAKAIIREAWENSRKPQGAYKAATTGAQIRDRFFTVVEEVEAGSGWCRFPTPTLQTRHWAMA